MTAEAKRTLHATRAAIERASRRASGQAVSSTTLRAFASDWLELKTAEAALATAESYRRGVAKLLAHFGPRADQPIADFVKSDLVGYRNALAGLGLTPKTVNHNLKCARMLFRAAHRDGVISENPAEFVAFIRSRSRREAKRPFSIPELWRRALGGAVRTLHRPSPGRSGPAALEQYRSRAR